MVKSEQYPQIAASYNWQGMACTVVDILPPTFQYNKYDVVVEYFDKEAKNWARVRTPWLSGCFELTFNPVRSL